MSDRDDELGRRVGVLLAPPEGLQARPDAGPLLRSRARTVTRVRRGVASVPRAWSRPSRWR